MHTLLRSLQSTANALGKLLTVSPPGAFNCGDCARNKQCGLPPADDCEYRLPGDEPEHRRAQWPISACLL